ncbi:MAG: prepilin-type N-terminal cleavage/methylation domain-containing protein [Planctomycetota bacterium]
MDCGLRTPRGRQAFTLVELLIVMAISSILFVCLTTFTHSSLHMTGVLQDKNLAEHTARVALERLTREASLASVIAAAEEYKLGFTCTDITGDGADDTVMYAWDSGARTLTRTLNGATETFAENVDLFSIEYQYESEDEVTIAAPGDVLGMTLASFAGVSPADAENLGLNIQTGAYAAQCFTNNIEVPAATSVTIRARTAMLPPETDMLILVREMGTLATVAQGTLQRSQLTTTYQDVTVPLTWSGGDAGMTPDRLYQLYITPQNYWGYAGRIQYQRILAGAPLGGGLQFGYRESHWAAYVHLGSMASMYFTLRGDLPVTTPRRSTVPVSILKKIKATIRITEGEQQSELVRTCKVVNQ